MYKTTRFGTFRPYLVKLSEAESENQVTIYEEAGDYIDDLQTYDTSTAIQYTYKNMWETDRDDMVSSSILFHIADNHYVWVSNTVIEFLSLAEIERVTTNFAVDVDDNVYLFNVEVVMKCDPGTQSYYMHYYINTDMSGWNNIRCLRSGDTELPMIYTPSGVVVADNVFVEFLDGSHQLLTDEFYQTQCELFGQVKGFAPLDILN